MRTEREVFIYRLVRKHRMHLLQRGEELVDQDRRAQASPYDPATGTAIFKQLLEGCLLTLAYSIEDDHRLFILDWLFTDPAWN